MRAEWLWMRKLMAGAAALLAPLAITPAQAARPVTDCPLRDAPYSLDSPLVDVLLSPAGRSMLMEAAPTLLDKVPEQFISTEAPTFAAIVTVRDTWRILGLSPDRLMQLEQKLRALPVTAADKMKRCERYDNDKPKLTWSRGKLRILLFEKINGFRDGPSVEAARASFQGMAQRNGWSVVTTDKGGAITPSILRKVDVIIWNNISGDVLTLSQRRALQNYVEKGGGFVAVHGSAGDPAYFWDWYADKLIGTRFIGHPMNPQFQDARIKVEQPAHPIASGLPSEWIMKDEWYSFGTNPRAAGAKVVLTLDESSYKPVGPKGEDLRMNDHPIAWTNCIGKGRVFYSAIGHRPEIYSDAHNMALNEAAVKWAADRGTCAPQP